jgi:hypothetical protein
VIVDSTSGRSDSSGTDSGASGASSDRHFSGKCKRLKFSPRLLALPEHIDHTHTCSASDDTKREVEAGSGAGGGSSRKEKQSKRKEAAGVARKAGLVGRAIRAANVRQRRAANAGHAFVCLHDVVAVARGHSTPAFARLRNNNNSGSKKKAKGKDGEVPTAGASDESLCFSLVTPDRTVDLVAASEDKAGEWVAGLTALVGQARREALSTIAADHGPAHKS